MSDSEDDVIDFLLSEKNVCLELVKKKRIWVEEFNEDRTNGEFFKTCLPLNKFPIKFREYYRLKIETFNYILDNVKENLTSTSNFRECISPEEKLTVTLR